MSVPKRELKAFTLAGGMNTELGLVNTDEKTAKNIENVKLNQDGSAERRSGLTLFESTLSESEALDITSGRSSAGWVYPAPSLYIWRTMHNNNKITDFLIVSGVAKRLTAPSTIAKELSNGISDIENWSTGTGQVEVIPRYFSAPTSAQFKDRFTSAGNALIVTNEEKQTSVFISGDLPLSTMRLEEFPILVRDSSILVTDSIVQHNNIAYSCKKDNTGLIGSTSEPGIGATWFEFWQKLGGATSEPAYGAAAYVSNIDFLHTSLGFAFDGSDAKHFTHSAFVGGRAWYGGLPYTPTTVYVTQPLRVPNKLAAVRFEFGLCFSVNDPLSTTDSSATAADGGTVEIRELGVFVSMTTYREGIIIFGTNGVWAIPNAGNFNATNFDVLKISDVPISGPDAFTETDFGVMYFGRNSVQLIGITDNGNMISQEISTPIKTFYNSISEFSKDTSFVQYNKSEQRVYWFTTFDEPVYATSNGPYQSVNFNRQPCAAQDILVFDFKLKAWYKHTSIRKGQDLVDEDLVIASAVTYIGDFGETPNMINLAGDNIINAAGDNLIGSDFDGTNIQEFTIMLVTTKKTISAGADVFRYGFAHLNGDVDQDFDNLPTADAALISTFDSEILTHPYTFADIGHQKQAPYIHTIFNRSESGIIGGDGNDITPGGCLLQVRWDWSTGAKAGVKFGTPFQAYRPYQWSININDGSLPDIATVLNKHKIRGRGKALQLQFTNDGNKRFHLLGYQLDVEATRKV